MKTDNEKAIEAQQDGEVHFCKNCNKVQPVELTMLDPDSDEEPCLIVCLICKESIGFIETL